MDVKQFLVEHGIDPEIADMVLKDADGLVLEGWIIKAGRKLVLTTPVLTWWGDGVTSKSRYKMEWDGTMRWHTDAKGNYILPWIITALDQKEHWKNLCEPHHPHLRPTYPCMDYEHIMLLPNPFVVARSIANMLSGKVSGGYQANRYGDESPRICKSCRLRGATEGHKGYFYHPNCWEALKNE